MATAHIPLPEIPKDEQHLSANLDEYNVIIMSQSCDLVQNRIEIVLVCPFFTLSEVGNQNQFYKSDAGKENLRRGNQPGYHLLNKCPFEDFGLSDYLVVDFRNVFGVHFNVLNNLKNTTPKRLRLLPPYREHLSQAFARFFMRVGLPLDIPAFTK